MKKKVVGVSRIRFLGCKYILLENCTTGDHQIEKASLENGLPFFPRTFLNVGSLFFTGIRMQKSITIEMLRLFKR